MPTNPINPNRENLRRLLAELFPNREQDNPVVLDYVAANISNTSLSVLNDLYGRRDMQLLFIIGYVASTLDANGVQ